MRFFILISPPVDIARFREIAATPLCHHDIVFERTPNEFWLETTANLYRLIVDGSGLVLGAVTRMRPCAQFIDLLEILGVGMRQRKEPEPGEEPHPEWDDIAEKYGLAADESSNRPKVHDSDLSVVETEVLRAIQLLAGPSEEWVDVKLFEHAFARNLRRTLHGLARKRRISFSRENDAVRIRF